ncbi:YheC/D like ATP-grasp [Amphibacillus marinus]|uniref:YheC/D like ATP-grasp n=1 Tax=Amphibacillus marinus TaxID=872970 RepID=A0A1H8QYD3_9BACI|nr:YheC/YheD family protein [Amphibacillus marinus]SEO59360.1 YheC/D like ATP-grasp [Amphibacillus marinus]
MTSKNLQQIKQVINITNTVIDAVEHLQKQLKAKDFKNSVVIFSSIVEGFKSLEPILKSLDNNVLSYNKKINKAILLIAKSLEQYNFTKSIEVIQFNLSPNLKKIKNLLGETIEYPTSKLTIGVYHDMVNPVDLYTEDRINALVHEAEIQDTSIFFFSSSDVDFDAKKINGLFVTKEERAYQEVNFPTIVHNIGLTQKQRQSLTERKLRREILFTSFSLGNKLFLPKIMLENRKFAELLVPFKIINNKDILLNFLNENNTGVIKPILGRQGQRIFFVNKKENKYVIKDHKKEFILSKDAFNQWVDDNKIVSKMQFMIQRYVKARTKENKPFDIRAHMQKNKEGKWVITKIYPRIGSSESILSNISRGGYTEDLKEFLNKEFSDDGEKHYNDLLKLSTELTEHLDKLYNFSLDELGLDITIDENGRFWLHEVNNGPQSTYHEKERAVNTIGYAKYVAENGILNTNQYQKLSFSKNQFNSTTTQYPYYQKTEDMRIGMLVPDNEVDELTVACAYVATYERTDLFYFAPSDIDFETMLIRGHFYKNNEWKSEIVEYPDVIYDRLRLRGVSKYQKIYEELEGIPITNKFYGNSISKLDVYEKLSKVNEIDHYIIPYRKIERIKDVYHFIDKYGSIIIKPEVGSFAKGVHYVEMINHDDYLVVEGENKRHLSDGEMTNYFRGLIKKGTFIVQKYIKTRTKEGNPFDIRAHMIKNGKGEWDYAIIYPRIGYKFATISPLTEGGQIGNLKGFIKRTYSDREYDNFIKSIKEMTKSIAVNFEKMFEHNINELAFDIAIDGDKNLHLIEINVNKPGVLYHEFDVAKLVIPYCKYIFKKEKGLEYEKHNEVQ